LPGAPGKSIPCRSLSDPPRATVPKLPLPNSPQTPLRSHQPSSKSSPPGSITWAGLLHWSRLTHSLVPEATKIASNGAEMILALAHRPERKHRLC
jgi:hypothetical protein